MMPKSTDWLEHIRQHAEENCSEIDLKALQPGDLLRVVTSHTCYDLHILENRAAILKTNRPDRPEGRVSIMGCTFGCSSSIKPDHLFCGGNLEFTFQDGYMTHLTTTIRELYWVRRNESNPG